MSGASITDYFKYLGKRAPLCAITCLLCVWATGCCATTPRSLGIDRVSPAQLVQTESSAPKGAFIVIHGLNQEPSTMDPLAAYLRSLGYHTYRATLRGHERANPEVFDFQAWESDVVQAYREVHVRYPSLPIHILGYSLGGLLAIRVVDRYPEINPKSMILLAPALSLRALVQTGLILNLFPPLTGAVPNIAPRYYRRFARTPVFWYQNTFDLYLDTREIDSASRLHNTKTLVFANPVDELVSYSGLSAWLLENELANSWQIQPLRPQSRDPFSPAHLVIDQHSLGERSWRELQRAVARFLEE